MDDEASGLHYEPSGADDLATLRQQAQSLSHNLQINMDRTRAFATASTGVAEMTDGLLTDDDPESLTEQLRELRNAEADFRLRRLLERAEHAADRGEHNAALSLVNEALVLDRTSVTAWLLRGRCLIAIGDLTQAARVITVAQRQARDGHEIKLAAALQAACEREHPQPLHRHDAVRTRQTHAHPRYQRRACPAQEPARTTAILNTSTARPRPRTAPQTPEFIRVDEGLTDLAARHGDLTLDRLREQGKARVG